MMKVKDSGVSYIGNIPISWYTKKIKYVAVECSESGLMNPKESQYIGLENIVGYSNRIIITDTEYELSIQKRCYKDNILFGKLRPYLSKVVIAPYDGFCTGEFLELTKYKGDIRFLRYSLLNANLIDTINMSTYGAKMPRANSEFIMNCCIAYPTYNEQKIISDFLDTKCEEIEALSMDIQAEIDTLEEYKRSVIIEKVTKGLNPDVVMKDSSIGWIPKVPSHWNVSKFKYHLKRQTIKNHGDATVLSLYREFGVIPKDSREDNHNVTSEDTSKYLYVKKGDFVINKMKAWQGSVAVSNYNGIVSPAYYVYEFSDESIYKDYFHYLMRNRMYAIEFRRLSGGIREGQWDLSAVSLENIWILIPPYNEQVAIAEYLNKTTKEIEEIINRKKEQLAVLEEYKKTIIYEYVTGKKVHA